MSLGVNLGVLSSKPSGDFASKMWSSYVQLNPGTYSDAIATEFKRRMKPDYVENLVPNGGGLNATDWIDTNADGLADRFTSSGGTTSIVTGNGFLGRAQRILSTGTNALVYSEFSFPTGIVYNITFTHRSNNGIALNLVGSNVVLPVFPANTGAAKQETIISTNPSTTALLVFYCRGVAAAQVGDWFEIGNITVTTNVSQNYFKTFGPSGLNKTTADWIYLLTTSGDLTTRVVAKTGQALKWNFDGIIVSQNSLPAYSKGGNAGIITVSATDSLTLINTWQIRTNPFFGSHPSFKSVYSPNTFNVQQTNFSGLLYAELTGSCVGILVADTQITGIADVSKVYTKNFNSFNCSNAYFNSTMIDSILAYINSYHASNIPTKSITINFSGATMGIPTGAGSNIDLLGILAKFTAAGFTATIIVRTV